MIPSCIPTQPRCIDFAIAYRRHLDRVGYAEAEPPEPNPEQYGVDADLAECLRLAVYQDRNRDLMLKVKARTAELIEQRKD